MNKCLRAGDLLPIRVRTEYRFFPRCAFVLRLLSTAAHVAWRATVICDKLASGVGTLPSV